ncbi:MAG: hypothetical protein EXR29_11910 [Betaproteobacteria bacterium]|nr:hypothetical protein [Betaproteobacteria bacterium]
MPAIVRDAAKDVAPVREKLRDARKQATALVGAASVDLAAIERLRAEQIQLNGDVLPAFTGRILAVDTAVAQRSARLHVPDPRPVRDGLIAATALVHRMVVVTRSAGDFQPMGIELFNPWQ